MHILIAAIGRFRAGPERALYEHYIARLPWKVTLREIEIKKSLTSAALAQEEAKKLLAACEGCEHLIALDERGRDLASPAFAAHLKKQRDEGTRRIAFAIGGAEGLHEEVRKKARLLLSFGRVTWPHMLVRGLLAEQLYRAHTIMTGHPYHRE